VDLSASRFVLPRQRGRARYQGPLGQGDVVLQSEASSGWELRVAGQEARRRAAFGWANAFTSPGGGQATLRHRTSPWWYLAVVVQLFLWVAAAQRLLARRRDL
jgi:hypothetical protein